MTQKANYFKLGVFVIIAFGLGTLFLIIFGAGEFFKKEMLAETCFNESVQGLSIGSEVKYKGIKIGTVKSITSAARVYQAKSDYVLVIISLEKGIFLGQTGKTDIIRVRKAVEDGLVIRLSFKGLTGVAYLETDYAESNKNDKLDITWTPTNLYIPSQKSNMKQFGDALNQIFETLAAINLHGITKNIESLLKRLDQKTADVDIKSISTLTASLLSELRETNRKVTAVIGADKFKRLFEDAGASFSELKSIVETSKKPLNNAIEDFQSAANNTKNITEALNLQLSPKIKNLSGNLDSLMESLSETSKLLENMVWLNSDKIEHILNNLSTTSENLKQMSKDLKRYPGRLLFEKPPENKDMAPTE